MVKNRVLYTILVFIVFAFYACREKEYQPASPRYDAKYDYSVPPVRIDVENTLTSPTPLLLSQIASEIQYFTVGDITFPVTQVLDVEDGFLTFNNPRTFYCKPGEKRKRYGFKTLAHNWSSKGDGKNLYYDKATTRVYCLLNKGNKDSVIVSPYIAELPPLDTMLLRTRHLFPEMQETTFPLNPNDSLLTFFSNGYVVRDRDDHTGATTGLTTFNLRGDTICHFKIGIDPLPLDVNRRRNAGHYSASYWDEERLTFYLPFCDTVYQLKNEETIAPLYQVDFGHLRASAAELMGEGDLKGKAWLASLSESPAGLFLGIYQEGERVYLDWWNRVDDSRPVITNQIVYLKSEKKAYVLPREKKGFINDIDEGMYFWPDGQAGEYLYMIRPASELKDLIHLSGSPKQVKLKEFLSKLPENQQVMIVVR